MIIQVDEYMNEARVREVMIEIMYSPERLEMDLWSGVQPRCGTVACFAGWSAVLFAPERIFWAEGRFDADSAYVNVENLADQVLAMNDYHPYFWVEDLDALWEMIEENTDGRVNRAEAEAYVAAHPRSGRIAELVGQYGVTGPTYDVDQED
jgi:hypothetical protein